MTRNSARPLTSCPNWAVGANRKAAKGGWDSWRPWVRGVGPKATWIGAFLKERLAHVASTTGRIEEVRGLGLMIGIGLTSENAVAVRDRLLVHGMLVNSVGTSTIRILPPLILSEDQASDFCDALESTLMEG